MRNLSVILRILVVMYFLCPFLTKAQSNNFVRTWDATAPQKDPYAIINKGLREVKQSTAYLDGLGRPLQSVVKQGSLTTTRNVDIVVPVEYDSYGREAKKYLPYASTTNDGQYKLTAVQDQTTFYGDPNGILKGQQETNFYNETIFELSPLNRVEKVMAPGASWGGSAVGVQSKYWVNTTIDDVKKWTVTDNGTGTFGSYSIRSNPYDQGDLYKNATVDERGNQVIDFKDKDGKVILKKVQLSSDASTADDGSGRGYPGWLSTYYIYDDLNQLRAVIQPRGVELLVNNGWALTSDILNEQIFRYEYDERGRMIVKKVPGAAPVYMVYDTRDRLVLSQDGNMRKPGQEQWIVTLYDELNRPVKTGLWNNSQSVADLRLAAYNSTAFPFSTEPAYGWEMLTVTHYDDYNGLPSGLTANIQDIYDTWFFTSTYNTAPDYALQPVMSSQTKGLVTWTQSKILGTGSYISSVNIYDGKGRVIQTQTVNYTAQTDITSIQYDFSGHVLRSHTSHQKGGNLYTHHDIGTKNTYDDLGRLVKLEKDIDYSGWRTIATMEYDALGRLSRKNLGKKPGPNTAELENITYDYNIRGWMLGANRDYAKSESSTSNYFGFDLAYDKTSIAPLGGGSLGAFSSAQLNGNIAGTVWKSTGDDKIRKYNFSYDAVNRLTGADFNQYNDGFNKSDNIDFSVSDLSYDANGNIIHMKQNGLKVSNGSLGSPVIDDMSYQYKNNSSNQLISVTEDPTTVGTTDNKLGDFTDNNTSGNDYDYDDNGNLKLDNNKKISSITYNYLNLPQTIIIDGKGKIDYTYDAAGNKLVKVTTDNTVSPAKTTTTLYMGVGVYENDILQYLSYEEGRMRYRPVNNGGFVFDYFLKDHLGNVRMVLTEEQSVAKYPAASMENVANKNDLTDPQNYIPFYTNSDYVATPSLRYPITSVGGYPAGTSTNQYVSKLNGAGQKIGPGIMLKVMAGDKVNITATSWYKTNNVTPGQPVDIFSDLIAALSNGIGGIPGAKATLAELTNGTILNPAATGFLTNQSNSTNYNPGKPKAFLNWVLFDEQFKAVLTNDTRNSGVDQVGGSGEFKTHTITGKELTKSGYLYVYVSNETPNIDVFFDNLQVTHVKGLLLEETHYYPFGLTMSGISSKAVGGLENRKKYNGIELDEDLDIDSYEAYYRNLDPQIARWWQIDPKVDEGMESVSPYASMYDDPLRYSDPLGDEPGDGDGDQKGAIRPATSDFSVRHPILGALQTGTFNFLSLLGVNAVDDYIADRTAGNNSPNQLVEASVELGVNTLEVDGVPLEGNVIKSTERGLLNETKVLKEMNVPKNNETFKTIDPKTNKPISVKPDGINSSKVLEIKDTKKVSNTAQIRGERQVAKQQNKMFKIVTGKKTHVSKNIPKKEIIRRKDLGPQKI